MSRKFQQWVKRYQNDAWSLARYLLNDASDAEDATQEAFIKLWNQRDTINLERIKPWLLKVTRNICLDKLRHRRLAPDLQTNEVRGPVADAERDELSRWLKSAIADLEEPFRSLVVLRDVQQHSYEEVARITELNLSQVKVYLHRARKRLREQLT
ncbi:MAG: sigma-70 family RNA polymerase sigma factor, partial [Gammaproteobacteria bacterium]|nr:sigma-70 family RNA polymerase sigma factor [Gammaproteobacteria bacterium]